MMTTERKAEIIKEYGRTPSDTGSPEVQVALLTERINVLTEHLKENKTWTSGLFEAYGSGRLPYLDCKAWIKKVMIALRGQ